MDITQIKEIVLLATAIISLLSLIVSIVVSIFKGQLKSFVEEKMKEAEATNKTGEEKLLYVLFAVKEKYKLNKIVDLAKDIVEKLIDFSKKINAK